MMDVALTDEALRRGGTDGQKLPAEFGATRIAMLECVSNFFVELGAAARAFH